MSIREISGPSLTPLKAFLVGAYPKTLNEATAQGHLQELSQLVDTFGAVQVGHIFCFLRNFDPALFITSGKLQEIIEQVQATQANVVIFDHDISPAQQRNLEKELGCVVMDRTEVILEVFAQRALTKEAHLQVELARTQYLAPRLKRLWSHLSRQAGTSSSGGGGAYLKGEGEKQLEIDRRILKQKLEVLRHEIEEVKQYRHTQRQQRMRSGVPIFALVGYTNAGKSTLLNALTHANAFVEDKLFATLDTTTRRMLLTNGQEILVVDTVGFIRRLPHLLIAAFRSTLEESVHADVIIHVIDSSHPMALEQAKTTLQVLEELKVGDTPIIHVLNKSDTPESALIAERLKFTYPQTIAISAKTGAGLDQLHERMITELSRQRRRLHLVIPQSDYATVAKLLRHGTVLHQEYSENDILLDIELPIALAGSVQAYCKEEETSTEETSTEEISTEEISTEETPAL